MHPGTIILINGTSSSGKTCLIHAFQERMDEPYLEAGIDKFIYMLPERYLDRPLWDDVLGLAAQAGATGHTLVRAMHRAIVALAESGCNVIADHVLVEPAWVQDCAEQFSHLPAYLVGVRCPLEVLEQREKQRRNRTLGQARAQFGVIHTPGIYDLEVDTARFSPQECAAQLQSRVINGAPPTAFRQIGRKIT